MHRIRSWAHTKAHGPSPLSSSSRPSTRPLNNSPSYKAPNGVGNVSAARVPTQTNPGSSSTANNAADETIGENPPPAPPPETDGSGSVIEVIGEKPEKKSRVVRFFQVGRNILFSSYFNLLLVFVPVGIIVKAIGLSPGIIFAMNAIAIVPLAGLLAHATESVARKTGDTIGALMNVSFGNAVELIIFIALTKNEIRIVQASLLGSILANLLLILGMAFLIGGLRFQEQLYNSTVTQMSACLLSLSVTSLLLPTAFHASFSDNAPDKATSAVLKVSRGTSVVLLIVYGMYMLFQLKSHAYMYQSTPQEKIDEELAPGPIAQWMNSSSDDSSSSSSDSDSSSSSNTTAQKVKRLMRGGRQRRKSSSGSKETDENHDKTRTPSIGTSSITPVHERGDPSEDGPSYGHRLGAIDLGDDADIDERHERRKRRKSSINGGLSKKERKKQRRREKRDRKNKHNEDTITENVVIETGGPSNQVEDEKFEDPNAPRRLDFAVTGETDGQKRSFTLRNITSIRPAMPKTFSQNVFMQPPAVTVQGNRPVPQIRYGLRRTNSLPDHLNQTFSTPLRTSSGLGQGNNAVHVQLSQAPTQRATTQGAPIGTEESGAADDDDDDEEYISSTTAIALLLISTGLVAICAEFMVDSINAVVSGNSGLSEAFIGLIILPIVGNAAEHVTAVTVATKNKMDLAIGVAVGSSIQIALFVTPFIVLLGWCMGKEMSLYFTLFETVSLFVSAFIVNFLVLDGRSNYLEGALLCAAYVIIAVAAFFYPATADQSNLGGNASAERMVRSIIGI